MGIPDISNTKNDSMQAVVVSDMPSTQPSASQKVVQLQQASPSVNNCDTLEELQESNKKYKNMASEYWRRWRHEFTERSRLMKACDRPVTVLATVKSIRPCDLSDVSTEDDEPVFLGHGYFSHVKLMMFHGILVAVKEYWEKTFADDVLKEAELLAKINHPFIPYLFGMNIAVSPFFLVMELIEVSNRSVCAAEELDKCLLGVSTDNWVALCGELAQALLYLHDTLNMVHNSVKANNIMVSSSRLPNTQFPFSVKLIDFGHATNADDEE